MKSLKGWILGVALCGATFFLYIGLGYLGDNLFLCKIKI